MIMSASSLLLSSSITTRCLTQKLRTQLVRRTLVSSVPRKKPAFAQPYETPHEILRRDGVEAVLREDGVTDMSMILEKSTKIALFAYLSRELNEPIPSNMLQHMCCANDITKWYSGQLKPVGALPHTRKLLINTLCDKNENEEQVEQLNNKIDLDREQIHEEFMQTIPENLEFDQKIWREADPVGLKPKWISPNLREWRKNLVRLR